MPTAMTVRCIQCGQENNPQYRFCGMCGAPLGPPQAPAANQMARERTRVPVSGPSFLGLGDEHSRDLDYLLEDEPPRGHGRLYFALLLLIVSAGLLAWHWQRDGYPWTGYIRNPASTAPPVTPAPAPPAAESTAVPAVVPAEPTANPAPPEAQPVTGEATPAGETAAGTTNPAAGAVADTAKPPEPATLPPATQPNESIDSAEAAGKASAATSPQIAASSQTEEPEAAEPAPKQAQVASPKKVVPKPSVAAPATTFEDRLVADGERYLYGRGVPQDCERAQRNLQIAARQSNAKAQTLLGAMYATGHCVGRDLPTAYRWFAKALHGDPRNSRVEQDLEVLWKQMTPEERRLAMNSQ